MLDRPSFNPLAEILVALMALQMFLAQTIFNFAQQAVEVILILLLASLLLLRGISYKWFYIFVIFFSTQLVSMLYYDVSLSSFALNTKEIGLALLSMAYFKKFARFSYLLYALFFVCIFLFIYQKYVSISFPIDLNSIHKNLSIFNQTSRPIGIFLDFHDSAFFAAIFLLGLSISRKLLLFDIIVLWMVGVRTVILSYIGQIGMNILKSIFPLFRIYWIQTFSTLLFLFLALSIFIQFIGLIIELKGDSIIVMVKLISNSEVYLSALDMFPRDIDVYRKSVSWDVYRINGEFVKSSANELKLITIFVQSGFFFGVVLLFLLTRSIPHFRVFIILSLFHYSGALSPIIIFTMFFFENKYILSVKGKQI